jgi:hypothetical protein
VARATAERSLARCVPSAQRRSVLRLLPARVVGARAMHHRDAQHHGALFEPLARAPSRGGGDSLHRLGDLPLLVPTGIPRRSSDQMKCSGQRLLDRGVGLLKRRAHPAI